MALLHGRRLITAIVLLIMFSPLFSFAQVKIKEKVEVHPKASANVPLKSERKPRMVAGSNRFFDPPLFVYDRLWTNGGLAFPGTLTISGSLEIGGTISANQHALLLDVGPWDTEHPLAWKGRGGLPDGIWYEGSSTYTGPFDWGAFPDVRLQLFDGKWKDGVRTVTFSENDIRYNFTGLLYPGWNLPPVTVTATATATGSISPGARFAGWRLGGRNWYVLGRDSTSLVFTPLDANGNTYNPWGVSRTDVEITLRVDAAGDYVRLAFVVVRYDENTGEMIIVQYKSGREITVPLAVDESDGSWMLRPFLVYDDSRGTFRGQTDTVYITLTGGGKSATSRYVLTKVVRCASVEFTPAKLAPGETATLQFRKEDGSAFDANTDFDVAIIGEGSNPGSLSSLSGSGTTLTMTKAPVTYVAPAAIEGDSLVVQVGAYAYERRGGSGGGESGGSTALDEVSPVIKKAARQISAQSVALNSDRAVLEKIGKLIAYNSCTPGEAVVKNQYPQCKDIPIITYEVVKDSRYLNCSANQLTKLPGAVEYPVFPMVGGDPERGMPPAVQIDVCLDPKTGAPRTEIASFTLRIEYGLCKDNLRSDQHIWTLSEVKSNVSVCDIIKELDARILFLADGTRSDDELKLDKYQNFLDTELYVHEEKHVQQDSSLNLRVALKQVMNEMRQESLSPQTADHLNTSDRLAIRAFDIQQRIENKFIAITSDRLRIGELEAQMAQSIKLSFLTKRLKQDCPQCK